MTNLRKRVERPHTVSLDPLKHRIVCLFQEVYAQLEGPPRLAVDHKMKFELLITELLALTLILDNHQGPTTLSILDHSLFKRTLFYCFTTSYRRGGRSAHFNHCI